MIAIHLSELMIRVTLLPQTIPYIMPLLNLFLFLSIIPLFLSGADFHTPAPFVEIMERSFTKPWSPQAISSISDREHVLLLDADTQQYCVSVTSGDMSA